MDNLHSSVSPSVVDRNQSDDITVTDYSQSGDDISTPTESVITMVPRWTHGGKGHKRSRSNTVDYSHLTNSSATTAATVRHRRSSSLDVNILLYKHANNPPATEIESDSPLTMIVKDDEQEEEQQQEQQQGRLPSLQPLEDEVDFSSMFGKWKGK